QQRSEAKIAPAHRQRLALDRQDAKKAGTGINARSKQAGDKKQPILVGSRKGEQSGHARHQRLKGGFEEPDTCRNQTAGRENAAEIERKLVTQSRNFEA